MKRPIWLLFFFLQFGSISAQGGKLLPLNDALNLHWLATENQGKHRYHLDLRTEAIYECANYNVEYKLLHRVGDNKIEIKLKGVSLRGPCLMGLGPATALVDMSGIPGGKYKLKIQYKNFDPFLGELLVSGTELSITEDKEGMIILGNPKLRKIPADLVWGKIEFKDMPLKSEAERFLADLASEGGQLNNLRPGDYGLFYLQEKGKQTHHPSENGGFVLPFAYHYNGDMDRLRILIKMYSDKFGSELRINMHSAEGKSYISSNL